jgi:spore coat polysaccharide biosynthesis protein SpsF (cytidylyltransferase family)
MKNVVVIIQARMGSTRLPGKVLLPLQGKPVIVRDVERVLRAKCVHRVVVAITNAPADERIVEVLRRECPSVRIFRGSEQDVLDRYYQAALLEKAEIIVRITSDCPLLDPRIIDMVVGEFEKTSQLDYASNVLGARTFPRGLDVEAISFAALERVWKDAKEAEDREHVTLYVKKHPQEFNTSVITNSADLSFHRWTLDEPADYELISCVYDALYPDKPDFATKEILVLFEMEPELIRINSDVAQKLPQF